MPVSNHPVDTIHPADTAGAHSATQHFGDIPVAEDVDTASSDALNGQPVMEVPSAGKAVPFARSPLHDTPSMSLLLVGLLAVALSYHKGYKYIENFFHYMFSTRRRENLFEDHTVNETSIQAALIANTCIVEGFLIYSAVQHMWPSLAPKLQDSVFTHIVAYCCLAVAFYVAQWVVYKVLGYTFTDKVGSKLWLDGFKASQSLLGLMLLPVAVLLLIYPGSGKLLLSVGASLYIASRLIFIYKGFRIFYGNLPSILYFLLYLCAVEMVPLVIMTSVIYWISGIL